MWSLLREHCPTSVQFGAGHFVTTSLCFVAPIQAGGRGRGHSGGPDINVGSFKSVQSAGQTKSFRPVTSSGSMS